MTVLNLSNRVNLGLFLNFQSLPVAIFSLALVYIQLLLTKVQPNAQCEANDCDISLVVFAKSREF